MGFAPSGVLYLIDDVILDNRYDDTIDFDSSAKQVKYFTNKAKHTLTNYTYIRKDTSIKVDLNIETLYGINYCLYRNGVNQKWIYCFIVDKIYKNEGTTEIVIETDVFQTYYWDVRIKHCYVDREHQNRWFSWKEPIYNIVNENLTLGDEYIKGLETTIAYSESYFLVTASNQLETPELYSPPNRVQEHPTPLYYYVAPYSDSLCVLLADEPSVVSISLIPFMTFEYETLKTVSYTNIEHNITVPIKRIASSQPTRKLLGGVSQFKDMDLPSRFAVGTIADTKYESKLLTFPYSYQMLTDYKSPPLMLKNEYLKTKTPIEVSVVQSISHDIKSKYYISSGYRGETNGKEYCLFNTTLNELPLTTDVYKNYMQQNKASISTAQVISGVNASVGVIGNLMGLNIGGAVQSGISAFSQVATELAKQKDLQTVPDSVRQMGNNISFDIADANLGIKIVQFSIHDNIKKVVGDYFAKYGYKCSEVKIPNTRSRYYYNYIKTIGCNLDGNMDNKDITKLKEIYDRGITIWHDREGVEPLNYLYDNVEMNML